MLCKALVSYNTHKLLHHNRPQAYFRRYSVATLVEIWAQDTRYIQQANLADPSCLQVDLQCSVYLNSSTIISSPLSNTILPEGHHRPPSRDLTTRPPSTRKHPGHTQCLKNGSTMCCSWLSYAEELAQLDNSERKHFNHPDHSSECLEVMGAEKHTRTITCHAENNRKATGPLN